MGKIINQEEENSLIMFVVWGLLIPIVSFVFVMLFLGGNIRDISVFCMTMFAILIRVFQKQLGTKVKFLYACIMPISGAIIMIVDGEGRFNFITQLYFLASIMLVIYFDVHVLKINTIVTLVANLIAGVISPEAYSNLYSWSVWGFILIVYVSLIFIIYMIIEHANVLYKEKLDNLQKTYSQTLYSLERFKEDTECLETQMKKFESNLSDFEELNEKILNLEEQRNLVVQSLKVKK